MRARLHPRQHVVRRGVGVDDPAGARDDSSGVGSFSISARPKPEGMASGRRRAAGAGSGTAAGGAGAAARPRRRAPAARPAAKADQRRQRQRRRQRRQRRRRRAPARDGATSASAATLPSGWRACLPAPANNREEGLSSSNRHISSEPEGRAEGSRMIRYALRCDRDASFRRLVRVGRGFRPPARRRAVACAVCGIDRRREGPDGAERRPPRRRADADCPRLARRAGARRAAPPHRGATPRTSAATSPPRRGASTRALRPARSIIGEARPAEARALIEDGIPVAPLPWASREQLAAGVASP